MRYFLRQTGFFGYGLARALRNLTFTSALVFLSTVSSQAEAEPVVLLAFGDSLTAGYGLNEDEGLVPQLQDWLTTAGVEVTLQNAGVSGDTTAGGLSRIDWALGPDVDALMVTLGGNDMLRGLPVAEVRRNLEGILKAAQARDLPVLLVGMKAPLNWGPEYKAGFDAAYPELAAEYGAVLYPDFFTGLLASGADPSDPVAVARYMQGDGIHPNKEGVKLIVEGLGPAVQDFLAAN